MIIVEGKRKRKTTAYCHVKFPKWSCNGTVVFTTVYFDRSEFIGKKVEKESFYKAQCQNIEFI